MAESFCFRPSLRTEWRVRNVFETKGFGTRAFSFAGSKCKFLLHRDGTGDGERVAVYLVRKKSPSNTLRVDTYIEDRDRKAEFSTVKTNIGGNCVLWWERVSNLRKREETITTDGVVTFVCVLSAESTSEGEIERDVPTQTDVNAKPVTNLECLSLDFQQLLDDGLLSDITLKCADRSIPVHRNILSARSEVFLAMLRSDMAESRTGIIEISDMEPSTIDQLVQYIYSGSVPALSLDSVQQLYAAADKYAIESLKVLCWNFMKENMTEENACSFLVLADCHGATDTKDSVLSFIMETELLGDDDQWQKFLKEYPKLANEVMHYIYKAKCSQKLRKRHIDPLQCPEPELCTRCWFRCAVNSR